ncbi:hypothetical protein DL768_003844 [Monosporascus sp. mg162]|nr:hypothetical protein DL768_003844 [Monosporascus sp. mg162]
MVKVKCKIQDNNVTKIKAESLRVLALTEDQIFISVMDTSTSLASGRPQRTKRPAANAESWGTSAGGTGRPGLVKRRRNSSVERRHRSIFRAMDERAEEREADLHDMLRDYQFAWMTGSTWEINRTISSLIKEADELNPDMQTNFRFRDPVITNYELDEQLRRRVSGLTGYNAWEKEAISDLISAVSKGPTLRAVQFRTKTKDSELFEFSSLPAFPKETLDAAITSEPLKAVTQKFIKHNTSEFVKPELLVLAALTWNYFWDRKNEQRTTENLFHAKAIPPEGFEPAVFMGYYQWLLVRAEVDRLAFHPHPVRFAAEAAERDEGNGIVPLRASITKEELEAAIRAVGQNVSLQPTCTFTVPDLEGSKLPKYPDSELDRIRPFKPKSGTHQESIRATMALIGDVYKIAPTTFVGPVQAHRVQPIDDKHSEVVYEFDEHSLLDIKRRYQDRFGLITFPNINPDTLLVEGTNIDALDSNERELVDGGGPRADLLKEKILSLNSPSFEFLDSVMAGVLKAPDVSQAEKDRLMELLKYEVSRLHITELDPPKPLNLQNPPDPVKPISRYPQDPLYNLSSLNPPNPLNLQNPPDLGEPISTYLQDPLYDLGSLNPPIPPIPAGPPVPPNLNYRNLQNSQEPQVSSEIPSDIWNLKLRDIIPQLSGQKQWHKFMKDMEGRVMMEGISYQATSGIPIPDPDYDHQEVLRRQGYLAESELKDEGYLYKDSLKAEGYIPQTEMQAALKTFFTDLGIKEGEHYAWSEGNPVYLNKLESAVPKTDLQTLLARLGAEEGEHYRWEHDKPVFMKRLQTTQQPVAADQGLKDLFRGTILFLYAGLTDKDSKLADETAILNATKTRIPTPFSTDPTLLSALSHLKNGTLPDAGAFVRDFHTVYAQVLLHIDQLLDLLQKGVAPRDSLAPLGEDGVKRLRELLEKLYSEEDLKASFDGPAIWSGILSSLTHSRVKVLRSAYVPIIAWLRQIYSYLFVTGLTMKRLLISWNTIQPADKHISEDLYSIDRIKETWGRFTLLVDTCKGKLELEVDEDWDDGCPQSRLCNGYPRVPTHPPTTVGGYPWVVLAFWQKYPRVPTYEFIHPRVPVGENFAKVKT